MGTATSDLYVRCGRPSVPVRMNALLIIYHCNRP